MSSFDVVSKVDVQEVDNAVNQTRAELKNRYDFKGSKCEIGWDKKEEIVITGDSESRLKALVDMLEARLVKRGVALKSLDFQPLADVSGDLKKQVIIVRQGIPMDKAKAIVKMIKGLKLKVQAQVQDDQVRVSGKKLDDLQAVIQDLKSRELDVALQFINMRS
ncbi:MAG: YajQ family cyclic di-GMP-binding protein [Thermodesulfobacteriota bacterium]